jgi:hypothetical protein
MIKELGLRWALSILVFVLIASLLSGSILHLLLRVSGIEL